jgi:anti-anti-sigma regulatory factor
VTVRISLSQYGTSFATRGRGEELREQVLVDAQRDDEVVVDLTGVEHVSYSFADEFLAKLHTTDSVRVVVEGAAPNVARTVSDAINRRTAVASSC